MNKCNKCGETKPLSEFHKDRTKPKGIAYSCKACANKTGRRTGLLVKQCLYCLILFEAKPSETGNYCSIYCNGLSKRQAQYSTVSFRTCKWCGRWFRSVNDAEMCSNECRAQLANAKSYARSRDGKQKDLHCKECGKPFTHRYGDKKRVFCSKSCCKKNARRIRRSAERARMRKIMVERVDPIKVFNRDKWRCQLCGKNTIKVKRGTYHDRAPELDHIIPLSKGGAHSYANTQCTCRACNGNKGSTAKGQLRLC